MRMLFAVLVWGALALSASPAQAQSSSADADVIQRPEGSVGDWWEVRGKDSTTFRLTVVGREGDRYVLVRTRSGERVASAEGKTRLYADLDGWVAKTVGPDGKVTDTGDKYEWVRFPLGVGKRWFFQVESPTVKGGRAFYAYDCKAEGWETIEIGGRRARALKISCQSRNRTDSSTYNHTAWYAPEAKHLVRLVSHYTGGPTLEVTAWGVSSPTAEPALAQPAAPSPAPAPSPVVASPPAPSPQPARETPRPAPPPTVAAPAADTEAPKIAINYPPPDAKVERDSIVVTGLVTDNVGVDRVQVVVNGAEVAQPHDVAVVGRGVPIRVPAALQPGDNVIEITAADKAGNVAQVVRTVTRVAPAVATVPTPKVANRWAVVIGVGEYEHKAIPQLRYATRDADAMYQFLTSQGGYAKDHVLLLTDTTAQKPTLLNIKRALGDFLARRAGRDDMVLIYFAGHGAPEVDVAGAEADGLSKYLVPRDGDPDSLYTTALPMEELQRIFSRIPAERIVMLLDTCYSGTAGGRTFARASVRASGLNDQFLERLTRSRGRVIITASGPNEVALELPDLRHGLFTYYVLEGLRGKADRNGDGLVTVSELYEYVEEQVDGAARLAGGRQRPLMKGEIEGTLPLSRVAR